MDQIKENIRLLSIFHYVVGGLIAVFSLFPLIYVAMGAIFVFVDFPPEEGMSDPFPAKIFGGIFGGIGLIGFILALTLSIFTIRAGKKLARYEDRTFCTVMAAILCAFMPFGTVLGIFTILTLTKPETKELFGEAA